MTLGKATAEIHKIQERMATAACTQTLVAGRSKLQEERGIPAFCKMFCKSENLPKEGTYFLSWFPYNIRTLINIYYVNCLVVSAGKES